MGVTVSLFRALTSRWYWLGWVWFSPWLYVVVYEFFENVELPVDLEPSSIEAKSADVAGRVARAIYLFSQGIEEISLYLLVAMALLGIGRIGVWFWDRGFRRGEFLSKGSQRRWCCAVDDGVYQHSFEVFELGYPEGELRRCSSCGLRVEFHGDNVHEPRCIWYELDAPDGTIFKSEISHGDVQRKLSRYLKLVDEPER